MLVFVFIYRYKVNILIGALARNGSFGFAKVSRLVCGLKPNVPFVGWVFKNICAVEKN
jgi:hypothetical protein